MFLTFRAKHFGGERGGDVLILVLVVCFAVSRGLLGVGVGVLRFWVLGFFVGGLGEMGGEGEGRGGGIDLSALAFV